MATGIHETTGKIITGTEELKQRLQRCMRTRLCSLPLARGYGSDLPSRIDAKITPALEIDIYADVANMLAHPPNGLTDEIKLVRTWLVRGEHSVTLSLEVKLLFDGSIEEISGLSL
ncbi:dTDP-glucose pyrophosphorylase [Vibrio sp. PP-XX7]